MKLAQIERMINNEKIFLGKKTIDRAESLDTFVSNFHLYKNYFEEGYYFAHSTKIKTFKKILRDGALLSLESYELQIKKPHYLR